MIEVDQPASLPAFAEGSPLVRYAGDWRSILPGSSAGLLQLMHPGIGYAVWQHSEFVEDPFGRIYRSIPQIWAVLLTPGSATRGHEIRDVHRTIKGTDDEGRKYHALDPDTFWWAHATFTWEMYRSIELFHRRQLSPYEREALYAETVRWYECYGVSSRPVPANLKAFEERFDEICETVLERNPGVDHALAIARDGKLQLPTLPQPLVLASRPVVVPFARALTSGCLPRRVRERFDISFDLAAQARFAMLRMAAQRGFQIVPSSVNTGSLQFALRRLGNRTRDARFNRAA